MIKESSWNTKEMMKKGSLENQEGKYSTRVGHKGKFATVKLHSLRHRNAWWNQRVLRRLSLPLCFLHSYKMCFSPHATLSSCKSLQKGSCRTHLGFRNNVKWWASPATLFPDLISNNMPGPACWAPQTPGQPQRCRLPLSLPLLFLHHTMKETFPSLKTMLFMESQNW